MKNIFLAFLIFMIPSYAFSDNQKAGIPNIEYEEIDDETYLYSREEEKFYVTFKELKVPLNYSLKKSRKNNLWLYYDVVSLEKKHKKNDPLIYFPGGPIYDPDYILNGAETTIFNNLMDILKQRDIIIIHDRINDLIFTETLTCDFLKIPLPLDFNYPFGKEKLSSQINCSQEANEAKKWISDEAFSADILAILKKEKIEKADIFASSWGGWQALQFAKFYPKKVKSILFDSPLIFNEYDITNYRQNMLKSLDEIAKNPDYAWPYSLWPSEIHQNYTHYLSEKRKDNFMDGLSLELTYVGKDYFQDYGIAAFFSGYESPFERRDITTVYETVHDNHMFFDLSNARFCPYHINVSKNLDTKGEKTIKKGIDEICAFLGYSEKSPPLQFDFPIQVLVGAYDLVVAQTDKNKLLFKASNMGFVIRDTWHNNFNCASEDREIINVFFNSYKVQDSDIKCNWQFLYGSKLSDDDLFPPLKK